MEKIQNILDNIKARFTNPLIFSFICSWVIINWEILIALIWFEPNQLKEIESVSIFDFISDKLNHKCSFWLPLLIAVSYTALMPIIKNLIQALHSWTTKWGESWNLKILAGGKISINKYLQIRADHDKRTKILEDVITKESTYLDHYNKVNTELLGLKSEINDAKQKTSEMDSYTSKLYDIRILDGNWENKYKVPKQKEEVERISIKDGRYSVDSGFNEFNEIFSIRDFNYNERNKKIFFVKELTEFEKQIRDVAEHYNINRLELKNKDLLVGTENGTTLIEYKRMV